MILNGESILSRGIFNPATVRTVHEPTKLTYGASYAGYDVRLRENIDLLPGAFVLGSTLEHFTVPNDLVGLVNDKSSLARLGIFLGVGVIEPGWSGWLTLEIKNFTEKRISLTSGMPIAQIMFYTLEKPASVGYSGEYMNQAAAPVGSKAVGI